MYNTPIITNKGFSAITYYLNNHQALPIQRMLLSETDYSSYDLPNFDIINFNVNLSANVNASKEKVRIDEGGIQVERYAIKNYAIYTNEDVEVAFNIKAVALTCLDENGVEIILAICTASAPYQTVQEKTTPYTFSMILDLVFNGSDSITIITTGEGILTENIAKDKFWVKDNKTVASRNLLPAADGTHSINIDDIWFIQDEGARVVDRKVSDTTYRFNEITYIDTPAHTGEGYEHDTTEDKWYKDGQEIEVNSVAELPTASLETKGKYYKEYLIKDGIAINTDWHINSTYDKMVYQEGIGFVNNGGQWGGQQYSFDVSEWVKKGYTKLVIKGSWSSGQWAMGIRPTSDTTGTTVTSGLADIQVTTAGTEYTFDISSWNKTCYLLFITAINGNTITDAWFEKDTLEIYHVEIPPIYKWCDIEVASQRIVTISATGWTTNTDSGGKTYYTINIDVDGMYADFVGTEDMQPVRPTPFNVDSWEAIKEEWGKISGVDSNDGYITVYATEQLLIPIDCYIFGL